MPGTIEEKIFDRHAAKRQLADDLQTGQPSRAVLHLDKISVQKSDREMVRSSSGALWRHGRCHVGEEEPG